MNAADSDASTPAQADSLAYSIAGPDDAPPVILVSSLGTDRHLWDELVTELSSGDTPRRVITVDHLGHGESPAPEGPYSIERLANAVLGVLDELGIERTDYVGLSLGGIVGMYLASHAPDRLGALALCATGPHLPPQQMWVDRANLVRAGGMQSVVEATLDRWFTDATAAARPDTVEKIRGQILACDPNGYAACAEAIGAMDLREDLAHINAPTLVVAGAEDPSQSVDAIESWARVIPGSRLEVLPGAHLVNLAEPAAFGALIAEHLDRYGAPT